MYDTTPGMSSPKQWQAVPLLTAVALCAGQSDPSACMHAVHMRLSLLLFIPKVCLQQQPRAAVAVAAGPQAPRFALTVWLLTAQVHGSPCPANPAVSAIRAGQQL